MSVDQKTYVRRVLEAQFLKDPTLSKDPSAYRVRRHVRSYNGQLQVKIYCYEKKIYSWQPFDDDRDSMYFRDWVDTKLISLALYNRRAEIHRKNHSESGDVDMKRVIRAANKGATIDIDGLVDLF
jgi:hypothetical protein